MTPPPPLPHPPMLREFPFNLAVRLLVRADIRATDEQVASFRRFAAVGDPLADALVAEMREAAPGVGRAQFERAVEYGVDEVADAQPALRAYFDALETPPVWLDTDKLRLAAEVNERTGLLAIYGPLPDIALMGGYLASRPAKVLMRAGDLYRKAPTRLAETAHWWYEVTTPGGLDRGGDGYKAIARVRLTHAHIRHAMAAREDWDVEAWDHPVNQIHGVGTLILFSLGSTAGLRALGCRFTRREREAVFHLWRYVGHLMGVHPDLLPTDELDTWRIFWLEAATEFQPDDDSRALAGAMLGSAGPLHGIRGDGPVARRATKIATAMHASLTRLALGQSNGDRLGMPKSTPAEAAILTFASLNYLLETARMLTPGATRLSVRIGGHARRRALTTLAAATGADLSYTREVPRPAQTDRPTADRDRPAPAHRRRVAASSPR